MRKNYNKITGFLFLSIILFSTSCQPKIDLKKSEQSIRSILANQEIAWNNGNLDAYMKGYWNSDSLKFISKSGIQYGWKKTLENYKKSYPDKASMGQLKFDILNIDILSGTSAYVVGKWYLIRENDDIGGYFTLLFKYIDQKWQIVCDHSS